MTEALDDQPEKNQNALLDLHRTKVLATRARKPADESAHVSTLAELGV